MDEWGVHSYSMGLLWAEMDGTVWERYGRSCFFEIVGGSEWEGGEKGPRPEGVNTDCPCS